VVQEIPTVQAAVLSIPTLLEAMLDMDRVAQGGTLAAVAPTATLAAAVRELLLLLTQILLHSDII
jgi:hypothetical protein